MSKIICVSSVVGRKIKPSEELDNDISVNNKAISAELVPSNHGVVKTLGKEPKIIDVGNVTKEQLSCQNNLLIGTDPNKSVLTKNIMR